MIAVVNGKVVDPYDPVISIMDSGFAIGEGVFETMTAVDGSVVRLDRHQKRMAEGCRILGLPPAKWSDVTKAIATFMNERAVSRLSVRFTQTRGTLSGGFGSTCIGKRTSVVTVRPSPPRSERLTATLVDWPRRNPFSIASRFKALGYGDEGVARSKAVEEGADIAIMLSTDGTICCADSANIFVRFGNLLVTPPESTGALCGTVRASLLAGAHGSDLDVREARINLSELKSADALYLTNAGYELCAVKAITNLDTGLHACSETQHSNDLTRLLAVITNGSL